LLLGCATKKSAIKYGKTNIEAFPFYENGFWGFNDKHGNQIIEPKYEEAYLPLYGIARVKKNELYGFIDEQGSKIVKCKYESATDFFMGKQQISFIPAIAKVKHKTKIKYIDSTGKQTDYVPDETESLLGEGIPIVMKHQIEERTVSKNSHYELKYQYLIKDEENHKIEYHDTTAYEIDSIIHINKSIVACRSKGKFGILLTNQLNGFPPNETPYKEYVYEPKSYTPKIEFKFEDLKKVDMNANGFSNFYIAAKQKGKWGLISVAGNLITPFKYESIISIKHMPHALVEFEKDKFGYITINSEYDENRKTTYSINEHFKG